MTLQTYTALRLAQGVNLTTAVEEAAAICGSSTRAAWAWHKNGRTPAYAERLLTIHAACTAEQRAEWFTTSRPK